MTEPTSPAPAVFNPRLVVGLIVAGIAGFAALMLLLAFGDRIGSSRTGRANALSVSAVGYKGLVDLTGRVGRRSYLIRTQQDLSTPNLVVVALEPRSRREALQRLLEARAGRPTLIILPKWITERHPDRQGWVRAIGPGIGSSAAHLLGSGVTAFLAGAAESPRRLEPGTGPLAGLRVPVPLHPQLVSGPNLRPLLELAGTRAPDRQPPWPLPAPPFSAPPLPGGETPPAPAGDKPVPPPQGEGDRAQRGGGAGTTLEATAPPAPVIRVTPTNPPDKPAGQISDPALIAQLGDQPHYVLADPDLLNNQALRDPARARAAVELLDRLRYPALTDIGFDLTVNGYGAGEGRSMLRTAFEPPFLAMTLALFVAALLAGLHGAFRFGPARREARAIAFGKSALVENSAGLIRLANREARLGGAYADVMRQEMARATAAPAHLQGAELDRYLNRLGKEGPGFSELAADLASARDRHTLMAAARRLWAWRRTVVK